MENLTLSQNINSTLSIGINKQDQPIEEKIDNGFLLPQKTNKSKSRLDKKNSRLVILLLMQILMIVLLAIGGGFNEVMTILNGGSIGSYLEWGFMEHISIHLTISVLFAIWFRVQYTTLTSNEKTTNVLYFLYKSIIYSIINIFITYYAIFLVLMTFGIIATRVLFIMQILIYIYLLWILTKSLISNPVEISFLAKVGLKVIIVIWFCVFCLSIKNYLNYQNRRLQMEIDNKALNIQKYERLRSLIENSGFIIVWRLENGDDNALNYITKYLNKTTEMENVYEANIGNHYQIEILGEINTNSPLYQSGRGGKAITMPIFCDGSKKNEICYKSLAEGLENSTSSRHNQYAKLGVLTIYDYSKHHGPNKLKREISSGSKYFYSDFSGRVIEVNGYCESVLDKKICQGFR